MARKIFLFLSFILVFFFLGTWWTDKNNPYSKNTWVTKFFSTSINKEGQIEIKQTKNLHFVNLPFSKALFFAQALFRIEGNAINAEKPIQGKEQQIIDQIHKERFHVSAPYVVTGGHFAEFYTRTFGIFYSSILDNRIPSSSDDWLIRQKVALQTIATDLELLKQAGKEFTTFIPVSSSYFVGANFNAEPSDSFFALTFTLSALRNDKFISDLFPAGDNGNSHKLETIKAANELIKTYKPDLSKSISNYLKNITDAKTGLVRKDIYLSSARDSIKRESSFYDNVIAWATAKLAIGLGLKIYCPNNCDFDNWKEKIISAFWDEKEGIFLDDLSNSSKINHTFSGDEFIVVSTQFLDIKKADDEKKLVRMIGYVKEHNLDKPFPLRYSINDEPDKLYFFVRYFAPSYMGKSIWSHWGMEYIKGLILLSKDYPEFLVDAGNYLKSYKENIQKYGGYPELYDANGDIFKTPFYKSVLHSGWVVNYEQTRMLYESWNSELKK